MPFADACTPRAARSRSRGFRRFMRGSVIALDGITANWVCGGAPLTFGRFREENFCLRPPPADAAGEGEGVVSSAALGTSFKVGLAGSLNSIGICPVGAVSLFPREGAHSLPKVLTQNG